LKNTVVRIPGPSSVENRCRCNISPVISLDILIEAMPFFTVWLIISVSMVKSTLLNLVTFAGYYLVLQFPADGGEISIVAGNTDE
jgi:hypothetical protein